MINKSFDMVNKSPSQAPSEEIEKKIDTPASLSEMAVGINKELFTDIGLAIKALGDPETKGPAISYLFAIIGKLSQGKLSEVGRFGENKDKKDEGETESKKEIVESKSEEPDMDQALNNAEVAIEESGSRSGNGTEELPYRAFITKQGMANGGCPGYIDGKGKFDPELAKAQLHSLHKIGIRTVFSLYGGNELQPIIAELKTEGITIKHVNTRLNPNLTQHNSDIFETLAKIDNVYIHCRHGAHRAIIATAGSLLKRGSTSLDKAFKEAGGNLKNFIGKGYGVTLLSQLIEYAEKLGIPVANNYLVAAKKEVDSEVS